MFSYKNGKGAACGPIGAAGGGRPAGAAAQNSPAGPPLKWVLMVIRRRSKAEERTTNEYKPAWIPTLWSPRFLTPAIRIPGILVRRAKKSRISKVCLSCFRPDDRGVAIVTTERPHTLLGIRSKSLAPARFLQNSDGAGQKGRSPSQAGLF